MLDNSPTQYWTHSIIYQKKRELAPLPLARFVGASNVGCMSSSRRRVVLAVCGRWNRGPKEPIARNTHIFAVIRREFSKLILFEQCHMESEFRTMQFHMRLFENNRFRNFVSTDRCSAHQLQQFHGKRDTVPGGETAVKNESITAS